VVVGVFEMSVTVVDALAPPAVTVSVSAPSVSRSAAIATEIVAAPLGFTVAAPLSNPLVTSAALTPVKVYGTDVPDVTLVVVNENVAVNPSFTDKLFATTEYVGIAPAPKVIR
jgi:hypothetical protein